MRRFVGFGIAMLVVVGAVVGIARGGGRGGDAQSSGGASVATVPADEDARSTARSRPTSYRAEDVAMDGAESANPSTPVPGVPARVVKNATVDLRIRRGALDARVREARSAAESAGGFVEATEESRGRASITLRVPSPNYAAVLDRIEGLGKVTRRSERGEDVTAQFMDLDARLRNLRAQEAVLQDLMADARNIPDTVTVQQQLSGVREQIEQLSSQQTLLDGQSTFATIAVGLRVRGVAPAPTDDGASLGDAWSDAGDVMVAVVGGMVVVLGALLPFAVLGLLGFGVWAASRRRRHLGAADA